MPKITFIDHLKEVRTVDAVVGDSLMDVTFDHNIPGLDADCGGACACATCHVYIGQQWLNKIEVAEDIENEMLEMAEDVNNTSRLACQVIVTEEMDGMVVTTPEFQA